MPRFLEVTRQTFLLQLRGRVYLILTVLAVLFACVFLFIPPDPGDVPGDELFELVSYNTGFIVFLPFVTLFLAAQAVSGDIEDRTSVYLFTRPLSRVSLLIGKWLAVVLLSGVYLTVGLGCMFVVTGVVPRGWEDGATPTLSSFLMLLLGGWLAVIGYSSLGCLFAAFFRRPTLIAVLYIFLEQFASRLPAQVGIHSITVAFPVRLFLDRHMDPSEEFREILRLAMTRSQEEHEAMLAALDPLLILGKFVLITMLLATWVYSRREYHSRPRE